MQISQSQLFTTILATTLIALANHSCHAQDKAKGVFSRNTIEIGFVVSDLEKSAKFYTEVVGMTEVQGFTAPAEVATKFGLTNNQAIKVRKFALSDSPGTPALKMMSFPNIDVAKQDQRFIHSMLGMSYLTMFVNDIE